MTIKVILDANFLIYCAENKIDYAEGIMNLMSEGYELVVPSLVARELGDLSKSSKKMSDRDAAKLALNLLEHNKVKTLFLRGKYADEAIIKFVKKEGGIVATLDVDLRNNLRNFRKIVIEGKRKFNWE
jgi:rRNA-processing protein FCF1